MGGGGGACDGGSAKQHPVHSTSTEQGQSVTRVCCIVVEVVAASVSNGCVQVIVTPYRISDGPSNTNGLENCPGVCLCFMITHTDMLPMQHGTPCTVLAGVFCITLPYSPDISLCDYHMFGPLKKALRGRRFSSDEAVEQ
jgi:hypothetical protein